AVRGGRRRRRAPGESRAAEAPRRRGADRRPAHPRTDGSSPCGRGLWAERTTRSWRHDASRRVKQGFERPRRYAYEGAPDEPPDKWHGHKSGGHGRRISASRTQQEMTSMRHHGGEDDRHAHQGDGRRPAETHLEFGAQHVELAHKQTEWWEAQERK